MDLYVRANVVGLGNFLSALWTLGKPFWGCERHAARWRGSRGIVREPPNKNFLEPAETGFARVGGEVVVE